VRLTFGAGLAGALIVLAGLTSSARAQTSLDQAWSEAMDTQALLQGTARADRATPPDSAQRCDELPGLVTRLAKSECERRDTVSDDAPAGMTPAIRERKERLRAQAVATYGPRIRY
jgi:hypothetical protein